MQVVDATLEHIEHFLRAPIRQDDIDEWFASSGGRSVRDVLKESLVPAEHSMCRALLNSEGHCICLWGVVPGLFGEGQVWLIASVEAEAVGKQIHRYWPREVASMHMLHSTLVAVAYGNNKLHLSWLEAIGFEPLAEDFVGPARLPFITYVRNMPCALQ